MLHIAILANSKRPDGQCLAGINLATGQWVRPVPRGGDGIPVQRCIVDGRFIAIRDVVEMDLARPREVAEFQRENQLVSNWKWRRVGRLRLALVAGFVEEETPVLYTNGDRVDPAMLRRLRPSDWRSLQLVRPRELRFSRHYYSPNCWVADFADRAGNHYSLKITDPVITRKLEAGEEIGKECLLTVSMAKPWTHDPNERPPTCYKLVAAVIEFPPGSAGTATNSGR